MSYKLDGFAELDRQLEKMKPAMGKASMRRSAKKAAQPMADLMARLAPRDEGDLSGSIAVSTKLDKRQAGLHRKMFRNDKAAAEVFIGPSYDLGAGGRHGHLLEFGTQHHAPQPFARPAWDQDKDQMLKRLSQALWQDIQKTIARANRRAAKG
jgi:HK97 gp10 family phage protein